MIGRGAPTAALALLVVAAAPALGREAPPRVAVQFVKVSKGSAESKSEFQEAVAGGLAAAGLDVLPAGETGKLIAKKAGLATCQTASCLKAIGAATGAAYVVRGFIDVLGSTYNIKLEMAEVATAKVEVQSDRCEVCTQKDAFEAASLSASALKARVFKSDAAPPVAAAAPATSEIPVITVPDATKVHEGDAVISRGPQPPEPHAPSRVLPWVGVGAGVAAIVAGAVMVAKHGDGTCDPAKPGARCPEKYNTLPGGIALLAGGAVAAGWGGYVIAFGHDDGGGAQPATTYAAVGGRF